VAAWGRHTQALAIPERIPTGGHNVPTMVPSSGQSARNDDAVIITDPPKSIARQLGYPLLGRQPNPDELTRPRR